MAWTVTAKIAMNTGLLSSLATGSGSASIKVYSSTDVLLHTYTLDHAASSVSGTTGLLSLVEGTTSTSVANGVGAYAKLLTRNDVILEDAIPVMEGSAALSGYLVVSSATFLLGGASSLISAVIG